MQGDLNAGKFQESGPNEDRTNESKDRANLSNDLVCVHGRFSLTVLKVLARTDQSLPLPGQARMGFMTKLPLVKTGAAVRDLKS